MDGLFEAASTVGAVVVAWAWEHKGLIGAWVVAALLIWMFVRGAAARPDRQVHATWPEANCERRDTIYLGPEAATRYTVPRAPGAREVRSEEPLPRATAITGLDAESAVAAQFRQRRANVVPFERKAGVESEGGDL